MPNYDVEATRAKVFSKLGLFSMNGRRNRKPYIIFNCLTGVMQHWIAFLTNDRVILLLVFIIAYMSFNNAAKRFQDLDHPGWLGSIMLLPLIPVLFGKGVINVVFIWGAIILVNLYLTFLKGTAGPNLYGPDPLGNENLSDTNQEVQLDNDEPQGKAKLYIASIFILLIAFALIPNNSGVKQNKPVTQSNTKQTVSTPQAQSETFNPFDRWLFVYDTDKGGKVYLDADTIKKDSDNIVFWIKTTIPQGMTHPDISKKFYSATYKYVVTIKNRTQRLDYLVLYDKDSNILKSYNWSSVDKPEAIVPESDLEAIFLKAMSIASKQQRK